MPLDRELFESSKILLAESDYERFTEVLLQRILLGRGLGRHDPGRKVIAEDGKGGTVEGETQRFEIE